MAEPLSTTFPMPPPLAALINGYDCSPVTIGESGGTVHRLTGAGRSTLYLKQGSDRIAHDIIDEFVRLEWLQSRCSVPVFHHFTATGNSAWLLSAALPGRAAYGWLSDHPDRHAVAVTGIARFLREMHALPTADCPFNATLPLRLIAARNNIDAGRVDVDDFQPERAGWSAEAVWSRIRQLLPVHDAPVVTHGDYSLDNIFLDDDGAVTGCIDVGRAGLADPYQDLAILAACLDEFDPMLAGILFSAYGIVPDHRKIELHLCLDELF